ncbi:hypothetical protein K8P10_001964 [Leucobacter sp. Psy1]|uniref:hypothetical protein n=1 Tax=Leucobacter sp. Psy1 TaxID=2875729 RepID=UPI001CD64184|nr:hypothetical protein [Leucobacter sp. Psy1]UBH06453.1 hypothetical protein K8P10_001964 [Leucobacter sp. Psy1]
MKAFVFANPDARGGAILMVGESIREAESELEERSGWRPLMGTAASPEHIAECDAQHLTVGERSTLSEIAAEGLAVDRG